MLKEALNAERLEEVRRLYEASFPESEKKPFSFMLQKRQEGFFDILAIEDGQGTFCGLVIMLLSGDFALLDYFAIAARHQGKGLGGETLEELRRRYGAERIVVEIERTEGASAERADNLRDRLRRRAFYLRNGLSPADLLVELMGVEMEVLTYGRRLTFQEYYDMYDRVMPGSIERMIRKVRNDPFV